MPQESYETNQLLYWAASVEQNSEHPLAQGILDKAQEESVSLSKVEEFESMTGQGLQGKVENRVVKVVSPGYVQDEGILTIRIHLMSYRKKARRLSLF